MIGFGAAYAGACVMLFERGSGSGGTEAQRAAGFEDTTEAIAAYLKAAGGPCVDEAKCELYAGAATRRSQPSIQPKRSGS